LTLNAIIDVFGLAFMGYSILLFWNVVLWIKYSQGGYAYPPELDKEVKKDAAN